MSASKKQSPAVTAQHKSLLAAWLRGTGRSELIEQHKLDISKGELSQILRHAAGDVTWAELNEQRSKGKKSKKAAPADPAPEPKPEPAAKAAKKEVRRKAA